VSCLLSYGVGEIQYRTLARSDTSHFANHENMKREFSASYDSRTRIMDFHIGWGGLFDDVISSGRRRHHQYGLSLQRAPNLHSVPPPSLRRHRCISWALTSGVDSPPPLFIFPPRPRIFDDWEALRSSPREKWTACPFRRKDR